MKTTLNSLLYLLLIFFPTISFAQSTQAITYDTSVTGSGNGFYTLTFPKFDPQLGTLTEVEINTEVTLQYSYSLENKETITIPNYRVRVVREDEISGSAIRVPLTSSYQKTYGAYLLTAADGNAGSGTDYISAGPLTVMNQTANNYTIYNTADYLGTGSVDITYMPATYTIVFGGATYNFGGNSADETNITLTYHYMPATQLASDITLFSAQKKDETTINLRWNTQNENNDRIYELQKSTDGKKFAGVARIPAQASASQTGSYFYQYSNQSKEGPKLIFRLKQLEKNGSVNYSPLRIIDISKAKEEIPRLYPNPANGATHFMFSNKNRGDWEIKVYAVNGQLVQTYFFNNVLVAKLNANNELGKGLYLVNAINKNTSEKFVQRLLIQ
jgi:Secretion system C-terminal sorting domain